MPLASATMRLLSGGATLAALVFSVGATCAAAPSEPASVPLGAATPAHDSMPGRAPHSANPILPGYFADPSLVQADGKLYIYATLDPWGDKTLGCWESSDFKNWTYRVLNWPTKQACTSPTSKAAGVWAPSVVRGQDGKFHMYVSVGSEVWAGVADHPLGPWRNALGDRPLVPFDYTPGYLRLVFPYDGKGSDISLIEWTVL